MIHVLPGMGADHKMYSAPAWQRLSEAQFLDWPVYGHEKSVAEVAARVVAEADIADKDTVIGSSLGGIVGCEIAKIVSLKTLVLIGGATNKTEISTLLSLLHPFA